MFVTRGMWGFQVIRMRLLYTRLLLTQAGLMPAIELACGGVPNNTRRRRNQLQQQGRLADACRRVNIAGMPWL